MLSPMQGMALALLTPSQRAEIERVMKALADTGSAVTVQQIPGVGTCRLTIERVEA